MEARPLCTITLSITNEKFTTMIIEPLKTKKNNKMKTQRTNTKQLEAKEKMTTLADTLRSQFSGYGHFKVSIEMDYEEISTITTNTMAIDAAFDDCYDDDDNSGSFYESRFDAQESLVSEILTANDITL